jgi:hypothetical protein
MNPQWLYFLSPRILNIAERVTSSLDGTFSLEELFSSESHDSSDEFSAAAASTSDCTLTLEKLFSSG